MLNYSELTIVNNSEGIPTALGYPVNSILLQNNRPLFVGGGGKKRERKHVNKNDDESEEEEEEVENRDFDQLAVPAGLVCMTQTICRNSTPIGYSNEIEHETIPEGLYEQLLALAESKPPKKHTRRNKPGSKIVKHKTKRTNR
jgi:hypothetical protein